VKEEKQEKHTDTKVELKLKEAMLMQTFLNDTIRKAYHRCQYGLHAPKLALKTTGPLNPDI
jgi:hypothetical protein